VLTHDVRFEGFTATDWTRVQSLFQARKVAGGERDPERLRGGVVAIHGGGKLKKLVHSEAGRLRLDDAAPDWPLSAEALAHRCAASWALIVEAGALESIMDRFGARSRRGDDLTVQALTLLELARSELVAGRIELFPHRLKGFPIPSAAVVRSTLDTICPVNHTVLVGLFDAGELWTSVALRRREDGIDLILGPDEIRADMGLLAGDFRRDYRHLARAVEGRAGPIALGCYAESTTLRALEVNPAPGAWARAVATRDVILSPLPPALTIPLGIDAGRAALSALRAIAERLDPLGVVNPAIERAKEVIARDGVQVLGFDPLELLRRALSRDR
jgi:hypothetical protein